MCSKELSKRNPLPVRLIRYATKHKQAESYSFCMSFSASRPVQLQGLDDPAFVRPVYLVGRLHEVWRLCHRLETVLAILL